LAAAEFWLQPESFAPGTGLLRIKSGNFTNFLVVVLCKDEQDNLAPLQQANGSGTTCDDFFQDLELPLGDLGFWLPAMALRNSSKDCGFGEVARPAAIDVFRPRRTKDYSA
tara:strand:- start:310 stop:642 length:333 start_codon:yes stop_codon:yes gene_type:complete